MTLYLVTGGAGFIGSHIAASLIARGDRVRILDNFDTGSLSNLNDLPAAEVITGDIRTPAAVRAAMAGVDFVFHQAAMVSVPRSVDDPITAHDVNATGTLNVLVAARDAAVRRVVFASSSAVYGADPALPKTEAMIPAPISPYAVTKLTGEQYCAAFHSAYGLETVALRYFNVFGPRQDPHSAYAAVIPAFIRQVMAGSAPTINGDGTQSRDFTYVSDVVSANLAACAAPAAAGRVINVATGAGHTLLDFVAELGLLVGREIRPTFGPPARGDIAHSLADVTRAKELLSFRPAVTFRDGLERTIAASTRSARDA